MDPTPPLSPLNETQPTLEGLQPSRPKATLLRSHLTKLVIGLVILIVTAGVGTYILQETGIIGTGISANSASCSKTAQTFINSQHLARVADCNSMPLTLMPMNKKVEYVEVQLRERFDSCIDTCRDLTERAFYVADNQSIYPDQLPKTIGQKLIHDDASYFTNNDLAAMGCPIIGQVEEAAKQSYDALLYIEGQNKGAIDYRATRQIFKGNTASCTISATKRRGPQKDGKQIREIRLEDIAIKPQPGDCSKVSDNNRIDCYIETVIAHDDPELCKAITSEALGTMNSVVSDNAISSCLNYFAHKTGNTKLCENYTNICAFDERESKVYRI